MSNGAQGTGYQPLTLGNYPNSGYQPLTLGGSYPNSGYQPLTLGNGNRGGGLTFGSQQASPSGTLTMGFPPQQRDVIQLAMVSNPGSQLVKSAFADGALSTKGDLERVQQIKMVVNEAATSIIAQRKVIDESIAEFYKRSTVFNNECAEHALSISKQISSGANVSQMQIDHMNFMMALAAQIGNRFFETANQLMALQKLNSEQKLNDFKGVVELVFFSRMKELDLLESRLKVLQNQSNFELQLATAVHNQQLKSEAQAFDMCLKVAEFNSKEDQAGFQRDIEMRKQKHQEEVDLQELIIKQFEVAGKQQIGEMEVIGKQKIETAKVQNEKEIAELQIRKQHKVEMSRISAEERIQWGKTIAGALKPTCSIM